MTINNKDVKQIQNIYKIVIYMVRISKAVYKIHLVHVNGINNHFCVRILTLILILAVTLISINILV